ncbi:hypothetical protein EZ428_23780 [Pedobacter frigiditerrae]|uniref:Uncharacterized protein n=1 Tax=Pedobacter frigiditerrae TaxID=2530452 RepID=A0A4V2MHH2_9SPHI|nr:hypothetical protein [Pedobacter frigiditerrae]TCC86486.1 hypothetical protein EZ428_23780 [Pedobacter frigiditerrae]
MVDLELEEKHKKYLVTIKYLRHRNFSNNLPFLILSEDLPDGQVYKEFPDGRIEIQEVKSAGKKFITRVVKILKERQAEEVRKSYGLL